MMRLTLRVAEENAAWRPRPFVLGFLYCTQFVQCLLNRMFCHLKMTGLGLLQQLQKIAFNFFPALTRCRGVQAIALFACRNQTIPAVHPLCNGQGHQHSDAPVANFLVSLRNFHRVGVKEKEIVAHRTRLSIFVHLRLEPISVPAHRLPPMLHIPATKAQGRIPMWLCNTQTLQQKWQRPILDRFRNIDASGQ